MAEKKKGNIEDVLKSNLFDDCQGSLEDYLNRKITITGIEFREGQYGLSTVLSIRNDMGQDVKIYSSSDVIRKQSEEMAKTISDTEYDVIPKKVKNYHTFTAP